jgi:pyruvate/2-oxoglutarate dehydrogenase complex dihydrolipoamide acyltransferase (E2) component
VATAIRTPRVNNNDDTVRLTRLHCAPGTFVRAGDLIAEVETDKASFTVEVDRDGYLLGFVQPVGEMVAVGSVLGWLGASADEAMPADDRALAAAGVGAASSREPTLKAAVLLKQYGLSAADVPASSDRLTADDVLAFARRSNARPIARNGATPAAADEPRDLVEGERLPLTVAERGMMRTVLWHRDVAVPGYVEIAYETSPWSGYAAAFRERHKLMMDPLLFLMAYRLVQLAKAEPRLNSTIVDDQRHQYSTINLGFTMQAGERLVLLSVRAADTLDEKSFVDSLGGLTRLGLKEKLSGEQTSGMTLSFSSMARWQVTRHVPILPPLTSLMVAHAHDGGPRATLGGTYDHRVLTGGQVAATLRGLATPPQGDDRA